MHRDDKPALIALALMLAAILGLAVIEVGLRNPASYPPAEHSAAGIKEDRQQNNGGSGHLSDAPVTDWLMVLLTGMATVISAVAVKLVNDTLRTSRDGTRAAIEAVSVTREIGERQLRPYIVYESTNFAILFPRVPHKKCIELNVAFRNAGASPGIVTARSGALYAPGGSAGWVGKGGSWQAGRAVIGQNHIERFRFEGISADHDGTFTWFSIGILVWYESLSGTKYEDHVWLTFDGRTMKQGFPDIGQALYRPEHSRDSH